MLDKIRLKHSLDVAKKAVELAQIYKADTHKAYIAGLLHDCAKCIDGKILLKIAKKHNIKMDPIFAVQPKLLHSHVSAIHARTIFGIKDNDILNAIASHTIGHTQMTLLEKIIYVADHIEPGRRHEHVKLSRKLAKKSLDKAIANISSEMIKYLLEHKLPVYELTLSTRNFYLLTNK